MVTVLGLGAEFRTPAKAKRHDTGLPASIYVESGLQIHLPEPHEPSRE